MTDKNSKLQERSNGWTRLEIQLFKQLYKSYKKRFDSYVPYFQNRTESQIKSFFYNVQHFNKIEIQKRQSLSKSENSGKQATLTNAYNSELSSLDCELLDFTFQSGEDNKQ
ncbi:SANT/Myb_domain [Hexamita inflata]|uniref:SANT/Myb domain n=1 Tax=Hexamita inflata TaxID=28002 RepID=A0AA86NL88_9EUKA|nr:SANT/Myb domain [Hexamita inflata]